MTGFTVIKLLFKMNNSEKSGFFLRNYVFFFFKSVFFSSNPLGGLHLTIVFCICPTFDQINAVNAVTLFPLNILPNPLIGLLPKHIKFCLHEDQHRYTSYRVKRFVYLRNGEWLFYSIYDISDIISNVIMHATGCMLYVPPR